MHPRFSGLFVHPGSGKPLAFFGTLEGDDRIPVHVVSQSQGWSEEILNELEKHQGEKWITGNWNNGLLWSPDEREMFPVIEGIPVFVPPLGQTWPSLGVRKLREGRWIERHWINAGKQISGDQSMLTEFAERQAEGEGLILDVASGPGGGFAPRVLNINPEATVLMDDLGLGVLLEWKGFLREKGCPGVSFALFDATNMPLKSDSMDMVSDLGGLDNIRGSRDAVKECYRVLKHGGTLLSVNSMVDKTDFDKLPHEVRKRRYSMNPPFFDGFSQTFADAGFRVVSHTFLNERELSPDEGDLPGEAERHGVRLHVKSFCTEAVK